MRVGRTRDDDAVDRRIGEYGVGLDDPRPGFCCQIVKVRVLEVDVPRKRISLTMKLDAPTGKREPSSRDNRFEPASRGQQRHQQPRSASTQTRHAAPAAP